MLKLLDFHAEWCGPCKMMEPILDELKKEMTGKVEIEKIDVDEQTDIAAKFGVMSIPTFVIMKDDQEVERTIGYTAKDVLKKKIESYI